jgi:hypothetical protein
MDPHDRRVLGFLIGFRILVANQRLLQDSPRIVGQRGAVTVDLRVHPDLDKLGLLPLIHFKTPAYSDKFYTMPST